MKKAHKDVLRTIPGNFWGSIGGQEKRCTCTLYV